MTPSKEAAAKTKDREAPGWPSIVFGTLLALLGGFVTLCFVIFILLYVVGRIEGGRAMPNLPVLLTIWLLFGAAPLGLSKLLLFPPAANKRFWRRILPAALLVFLLIGADENLGPANWRALFRREKLPGTDATNLLRTTVTPHLETKIAQGTNVLWCGTFQLAWNEACRLAGGDLHFDRDDPMVTALNQHAFTKDSIDDSSYVALAGFVKDNIHQKIRSAVDARFNGSFKPRLLPDPGLTPRPQDFVAYACLHKNLSFPVPFERLDEALTFEGVQVCAFGFQGHKAAQEPMYPQVLILNYLNEDDLVIELKTKSVGDRLVLAKMQLKGSLNDTIKDVLERSRPPKIESAATNDILILPRIRFDITRTYSEIENRRLAATNRNIAKDLLLCSAVQNTAFEMNEKGVELRSESAMAFGCGKEREPVPQHKMIFDKPFLVLLLRTGASTPYFALWVDNPELLVAWK